ncbi:aromatic ring-hydroxylating oxygenase subunit alpha [Luteimonas mephitis]|uniref:aromatic ring-hydroxylating oxygenase subunit alpha n=1 Tax=Luteimonas mephitis TaxID=83615 RepID=UPI003A8D038C
MDAAPSDPDLATQPPGRATALPARFYCEPAMAALDRRAVFDRGWQLVAHVSQLRDTGDHVVADLSGLPVIAVRGADGEIRVLHNVCRHRAGPIAQCDGLAAKSLRCRYHGWTYALDGALKSAPEMGGAEDFDVASIRLPQLRSHVWQGLVFACSGDHPPPFDALVAGIDARLGTGRDLAGYGHHQRVGYDIACNWKAYVDNYLEGYHLPHVHPALNRILDYRSYVTELSGLHSLQWSPLESDGSLYGNGDALYYWLWPNTMLNILPGRLQTNRVVPLGVDRCRVEFDFYYPLDDSGEARARRDADREFSDDVQHEDIAICEDVQRGLASGSYVAGRLNPLRESGVRHFHELLRHAYREA